MKLGLNGLSRLCHITCFFTSTIRHRPRLSRALLLSLFSMPDKLSDCRSFQFFSRKMASFRISDFSSLIPIKKRNFVQWYFITKKKTGKLERTSRLLESAGILPFSCQERRGDDSPGWRQAWPTAVGWEGGWGYAVTGQLSDSVRRR